MKQQDSGSFWMLAAALVSLQLAQGRSGGELDLLSAFFTVVADNLALLAGLLPEEAAEGEAEAEAAEAENNEGASH